MITSEIYKKFIPVKKTIFLPEDNKVALILDDDSVLLELNKEYLNREESLVAIKEAKDYKPSYDKKINDIFDFLENNEFIYGVNNTTVGSVTKKTIK